MLPGTLNAGKSGSMGLVRYASEESFLGTLQEEKSYEHVETRRIWMACTDRSA